MSILIKGMEMPTRCGRCNMCVKEADGDIDYHYACCITAAIIDNLGEKMEDCPLVPVPPHGDLIDRDALMKILSKVIDINASIEQRNEATDQERRCLWWFEQQIGIAPTIIPAEEGEA